jgi:hypothetical protein
MEQDDKEGFQPTVGSARDSSQRIRALGTFLHDPLRRGVKSPIVAAQLPKLV